MGASRAQPLLGTVVRIGASVPAMPAVHRRIDMAFAEIARLQALMSYQDPDSDVARLNRHAARHPVAVHADTASVLGWALALSAASEGAFDVSARGAAGSWRDIELSADGAVRFHAPLEIDLSGIAKGFAVDRAIAVLEGLGDCTWLVDAGGDLRVSGPDGHRALLRHGPCDAGDRLAVVELANAALASSGGTGPVGETSQHFDGRTRCRIDPANFAAVVAPHCMAADALTKVVLACPEAADAVLGEHGATGFHYGLGTGWTTWGKGA